MYEIMWTDNIASLPRKSVFEGVLYLNDGSTKQYRKWTVPYNEEDGQISFRVCNPNTGKEVELISLDNDPWASYKPDINITDNVGIITFDIETMRRKLSTNDDHDYHFKGVEKDTLNTVNVYFIISISSTQQLKFYYNGEETYGLYFRLYDQKYYDWDSDKVKTLPKLNPIEFIYKPSNDDYPIKDIDHIEIEYGPYDNHTIVIEDTDDGKIIRDTVSIDPSYKDPDDTTPYSYYSYKVHVYDTDGNHYLGELRYLADTRKTTSFNAFVLHNGTGDMAFDDVDTSDPNDNRKRSSNIVNMDGTEEILMFIFMKTDDTEGLGAECTITRADDKTGYELGTWALTVDYSKCSKGISKLVFQGMDRYNNIRTLKLNTVIK